MGLFFSHKEKQNHDICRKMDRTDYYDKQNITNSHMKTFRGVCACMCVLKVEGTVQAKTS